MTRFESKKLQLAKKLFLLIVFCLSSSCQKELSSCNCIEINVYGYFSNVIFPIRVSEEDVRAKGIEKRILDFQQIDSLKSLISNLEVLPEKYGGIDVRMVLDFKCKNGGKATVLMNSYIVEMDDQYYEPSETLIEFFSRE